MEKLKIWSMMMLVAMALPMMVACGDSDDDEEDDDITITKAPSIAGTWYGTFYDDDEDDAYNEIITFGVLGAYKNIDGLGEVSIRRYDVPVTTYEQEVVGTYTQTHQVVHIQTERTHEKDMKTHEWKGWVVGGEIVELEYKLSKDKKTLTLTDPETGGSDVYYKQ